MSTSDSDGTSWLREWAWNNKDWILAKLEPLYRWYITPRPNKNDESGGILILGSGGVGKTTLAQTLSGGFNWFDLPGEYSQSLDIEEFALKESTVEIVVPPGQKFRRDSTWPDLLGDIATGRFSGVVMIASYGFHSVGPGSFTQHEVYKAGDSPEVFLDSYLPFSRKEELDVLRRLAPAIESCRKKIWLLTLVTKQDLWWEHRMAVEDYYRNGEFGEQIKTVLSKKNAELFRYEIAFASLVINKFKSGHGELLLNNVAGYDQGEQIASLRRLIETVDALKTWENRG